MHIQATRPFWYAGAVVPVGTVLALPAVLAAELVHNGKAQACAAPAPAAEPATAAATPATPATPAAPAPKAKAAPKATPPKPMEATP
jgi:5'-nucleotidase